MNSIPISSIYLLVRFVIWRNSLLQSYQISCHFTNQSASPSCLWRHAIFIYIVRGRTVGIEIDYVHIESHWDCHYIEHPNESVIRDKLIISTLPNWALLPAQRKSLMKIERINADYYQLGTQENNCEIWIKKKHLFSSKRLYVQISSAKWLPFWSTVNNLNIQYRRYLPSADNCTCMFIAM